MKALQKLRNTQPFIRDHSPLDSHRPTVANGKLRSEATAAAIASFSRRTGRSEGRSERPAERQALEPGEDDPNAEPLDQVGDAEEHGSAGADVQQQEQCRRTDEEQGGVDDDPPFRRTGGIHSADTPAAGQNSASPLPWSTVIRPRPTAAR